MAEFKKKEVAELKEEPKEVKKEESDWKIENVATQVAPAILYKDVPLTEQQILMEIIKGIEFIKKRIG